MIYFYLMESKNVLSKKFLKKILKQYKLLITLKKISALKSYFKKEKVMPFSKYWKSRNWNSRC